MLHSQISEMFIFKFCKQYFQVLSGYKDTVLDIGSGRVLESNSTDNVLIYFATELKLFDFCNFTKVAEMVFWGCQMAAIYMQGIYKIY